jgi:nitric oxide reductase NorQ protein
MHTDVPPTRTPDPVATGDEAAGNRLADIPSASSSGRTVALTDRSRTPAMTTPTSGTAGPVNPVTGLPRLRPGELQAQVLGVLAANPGKALNVSEIAQQLYGRSTGAVGQACDRLVELAHVTRTASRFAVTTAGLAQHRTHPGPPPVPPVAPPAPPGPAPATSRPTTAPPVAHPASSAGRPTTTSGPVRRPNGQLYYPRRLAKRTDVDVLRDLRTADVPVLLYGPPGTGKTSLIEATFGTDLYTVPGDGDTTVGDIIGDYVPVEGGGYEFVPGPLPQAMTAGGVLFIDDATLIAPKVLAVVYPAMDGRRQIILKAHAGTVVTAAPGFYVVAGHNPGVHGAVLTEALSSRFSAQIKVSTDYDLAAALGVDSKMVRAARNLATQFDSGTIGWAPQLRELLAFKKITDVLGIDTAVANLVGVAPLEDRDAVVKAIRQTFASPAIEPLALGKQL